MHSYVHCSLASCPTRMWQAMSAVCMQCWSAHPGQLVCAMCSTSNGQVCGPGDTGTGTTNASIMLVKSMQW